MNTKYLRSRFCLLSISFLVCAGGFFHQHRPVCFLSPFDNAILFERRKIVTNDRFYTFNALKGVKIVFTRVTSETLSCLV